MLNVSPVCVCLLQCVCVSVCLLVTPVHHSAGSSADRQVGRLFSHQSTTRCRGTIRR